MFRFENFDIWKRSIQITDQLFDVADAIERKHHYRFADQLRGASLSISNNIAEGSGSISKKEFSIFLNYAHRSVFETVNMIMIAGRRNFMDEVHIDKLKKELEEISKMISGFSQALSPLRSRL